MRKFVAAPVKKVNFQNEVTLDYRIIRLLGIANEQRVKRNGTLSSINLI